MRKKTRTFDESWKEALEHLFQYFMEFFFPEVYEEIDWDKGYETLDNELHQALESVRLKKRLVDKLVRVWRKNGKAVWILLHVEVQSQQEKNFAHRMFLYNFLIHLRHNREVFSYVILGDSSPSWKPEIYGYNKSGNQLFFRFAVAKLLDYRQKWTELENSDNPFAILVMAHLKALETGKDIQNRSVWKYEITRSLFRKNFSKELIRQIFAFIDVVLWLPKEIETEYKKRVVALEEEGIMVRSMLPIEEVFYDEGREEGILDHSREAVLQVLIARFNSIPASLAASVKKISSKESLTTLLQKAVLADSIQEFKDFIKREKNWG